MGAIGYNLRLLLAWLRMILRLVLLALIQTFPARSGIKSAFYRPTIYCLSCVYRKPHPLLTT